MSSNGTHLDRLMTELALENFELARKVGVGRQAIWKLRTGLTRMLPHWAKRLAPHLGVSWQELIEGPPSPADQERAEWWAILDDLDDDQRRALKVVAKGMLRRGDRAEPEPVTPPPKPEGSDGRPFWARGNDRRKLRTSTDCVRCAEPPRLPA